MNRDVLSEINQNKMSRYQWFVISICICLNIIDGFDVMVMAFTAPSVSMEWSLSGAQIGLLLSAGLFGMAAGSIFLAPFADKVGRRLLILSCLVISGLSMLACAFVDNHNTLALLRFITGIGVGGILASSNVLASEYANGQWRSLAVSLMSTGYGIGATLGGVLSLALIEQLGWRSIFLAGGIATIMMLFVSIWLLPESLDYLLAKRPKQALKQINITMQRIGGSTLSALPHQVKTSTAGNKGELVKLFDGHLRFQTLCLWFAFFLVMFGFYFVMSWTPKILLSMGMSADQGVTTGILISIGGIFGAAIIGLLASRIKIFYALSLFLGLTAVCVFLFVAVSTHVSIALVVGLLLGTLINGCVAGLYSISPTIYDAEIRSRGVGYAIGFGRIGAILSPTVAGIFLDKGIAPATLYAYYGVVFILAIFLILSLGNAFYRNKKEQNYALKTAP
ncbi:MFS transporter [Acinetobacter haemolyticus]|uniref:MFS transporter n=1 Tax=Acinetobacter haemolyticus TaxID=29430 RepID=UPI001372EC78|nr:MFS transporter [Acinetobacter haemolyticus]NAR77194.1 MFS transporter [Acinetobacter haemolyticus]NAR78160.1 MFS transporter [Acinetobacter haemolyticus]